MDLAKREKIKGKRKQDLSLSKVLKRHRYLLAISGSTTVYLFSTDQEKSYTWANQYVRQIQNRSYEILPNSSQLSPMVDKILLNLFRSISKDTCLSIGLSKSSLISIIDFSQIIKHSNIRILSLENRTENLIIK